jgi:hypothetical protein
MTRAGTRSIFAVFRRLWPETFFDLHCEGEAAVRFGALAHWDGSAGDEEVIVQVIGYGPSGTTPETLPSRSGLNTSNSVRVQGCNRYSITTS